MSNKYRILQRKKAVLSFLAALVLLVASCSRTEPKIVFGFIELVYYQEQGGPREHFSFFIIPEDEDGIENLADLYLYHDREQLRWHISSEDWISYTEGGNTWIGTRSLAIDVGERLPRGQFRAVLVNKGGERSERIFSFDAPEDPIYPFPTFRISEGNYTAVSAYPHNQLVCYDDHGNFLGVYDLANHNGSIEDWDIPDNTRSVALWAQDAQHFTSAFTDVTSIYQ